MPILRRTKLPVPYVFFAMPTFVHACPNNAACWSPAIPEIGIPFGTPGTSVVTPNRPLDGRTVGRTDMGTPRSSHISALHCNVLMSNNIVRLAFEGSVTNAAPAVSFHTSHESIVPIHKCSTGGTAVCCNNQAALVPEKYGSRTRPVTARTRSSDGSSSSHRSAVRRSCHTIACAVGCPFRLSHARTVSR